MAVMMDTEGSEVHMGDIGEPRKAEVRPQILMKVNTNKGYWSILPASEMLTYSYPQR
jgi:hypothetical protein